MTPPPCRHCGQPRIIATSIHTGCCPGERQDWARSATIPATAPWKPTRDQVRAAAMSFARVSGADWMRLPASSREDFLIDGHAALMAAHAIAPIPGAAGANVVCMSREHADAYAELFKLCEQMNEAAQSMDTGRHMELVQQRLVVQSRIRSLASPEGIAP